MDGTSHADNELQRELAYYKKKLDELSGESISHDYALSSLRYELKQKKEAFAILSSLQKEFTVATPLTVIYTSTVKEINNFLGMDRAMVLTVTSENNTFKAGYWYGFPDEQVQLLANQVITVSTEILKQGFYLLLNKATEPDEMSRQIQQLFSINYFIGVPVLFEDKPIAFLLCGRQFEKVPFYQPLNKGDADTLMAIASLISMVLQNKKMVELRAEMIKQKEENTLISKMLAELKATQAQLIQREKMASLGDLTAGVAHEIQNPLNFVNNFSEICSEFCMELKEEVHKPLFSKETIIEIAETLVHNLQKINYHGRRADAIVKGMLQHSIKNTGQKEPTDINALAEEYLKLCYHSLKVKDKDFNVCLHIRFDERIGKVDIVPQDIGRVLVNLFNNAFYSVMQKARNQSDLIAFEPAVWLNTRKQDDKIEITVKDNGMGIPKKVVDKIYQPFFTTKPTGQGTGLGLSLSYDIITKEHGGELKVETKEGEYAEFVIQLPVDCASF